MKKFDFSGWATKNDLRCSDGRTIRRGAFAHDDGHTVPLVWQHQHDSPENVLGHALLENRDNGVYAYCAFNDTDMAKHAKELVRHGDICSLSIYANGLKQHGGDVLHGSIREVSLVLAGANPGAMIDFPVLEHGEESETEAMIFTNEAIDPTEVEVYHSNESEVLQHKENDNMNNDKTVKEVFDTLTEEQKNVVYFLIGNAINSTNGSEEDEDMKHNVFEGDTMENTLTHADMEMIIGDAKRFGSLKESILQHGIEDIDILFPDAHNLNTTPEFIKREDAWVSTVMNGTHHTPFSRIKSMFADITEDDARALGYFGGSNQRDENGKPYRDAKGNMVDKDGNKVYKKEEVFSLLKRTTTPTTVYKKQKLDRDDVVDITDFNVIAWIKSEMRGMLNEEIARAILVGDGRLASSDDKINETNVRPIWKDDDLFTIKHKVEVAANATEDDAARAYIRAANKARKNYRGSGSPTFFTTEDMLTNMMLLEDTNQHRLYQSQEALCSALRVSKIVTVPVMENLTRVDNDNKTRTLIGIIVNLADYNVGADKGGEVSMFEDFDIDYNAQKYLIETRCSGALIKPYSAIAIESITAST